MTINASGSSAWVCCQLGAREHYAIPRALARHSVLDQTITDAWVPPTSFIRMLGRGQRSEVGGQQAEVSGSPRRIRQSADQRSAVRRQGFATANPSIGGSGIAERFHSELRDARVTAFNWSLVAFEILARVRGLRGWDKIIARNNWFQRKAVSALRDYRTTGLHDNLVSGQLSSGHVVLFSYSYAARKIFRFAKQRGWKTVLGQIDPGPVEEKIVAEEAARVPELAGDWQPAPPEYWDNWQEEYSLADHIIVNSEWSRTCLLEAGVNGSKLSVVPLAYEMSEVRGQRSEVRSQKSEVGGQKSEVSGERQYPDRFDQRRPLRVLFLGQVNLRKGVARLFDAIRQLKNEPVEFEFVGRVQVAVPADLKNNARVRWCDAVPRGKTADFYRTADVLIFPTLSDGFGLTQLEAQAHGLPVIASRCCGEVVKHGVNGLLLDEPVADAIVEALQFCLADLSRLAAFSTASRVEGRFSLDSLAQNLLSLTNA